LICSAFGLSLFFASRRAFISYCRVIRGNEMSNVVDPQTLRSAWDLYRINIYRPADSSWCKCIHILFAEVCV